MYPSRRTRPLLKFRGVQRVAAASAYSEDTEAVSVYAGIRREVVGHAVDVFGAVEGHVLAARFAAARALEGRVGRYRHVAELRQALREEARDLFLYATVGVGDCDGGIFFRFVVARGRVDVGGDFNSVQFVADGVDVDLARFVFRYRAAIDEAEGIFRLFRRVRLMGESRCRYRRCRGERHYCHVHVFLSFEIVFGGPARFRASLSFTWALYGARLTAV